MLIKKEMLMAVDRGGQLENGINVKNVAALLRNKATHARAHPASLEARDMHKPVQRETRMIA